MANMDDQNLLTERDTAKRLNVSVKKLQRDRLERKGCPYLKIGRLVRYRPADIERFMQSQIVQFPGN